MDASLERLEMRENEIRTRMEELKSKEAKVMEKERTARRVHGEVDSMMEALQISVHRFMEDQNAFEKQRREFQDEVQVRQGLCEREDN